MLSPTQIWATSENPYKIKTPDPILQAGRDTLVGAGYICIHIDMADNVSLFCSGLRFKGMCMWAGKWKE